MTDNSEMTPEQSAQTVSDERLADLAKAYQSVAKNHWPSLERDEAADLAAAMHELQRHRASNAALQAKLEAAQARIAEMEAALSPHAKWLRMAADEIAREGHAGWGNTCLQAADAIDAQLAPPSPPGEQP